MEKNLYNIFKESARSFVKNPILLIPGIVAVIFIYLFSKVTGKISVAALGDTKFIAYIIPFVITLVMVLCLAYLFSGLIGMCFALINGNASFKSFFSSANKSWIKSFFIILIIIISYNVVNLIAFYGASLIGKGLSLSTETAKFLFFFIYFAGLIGLLIFLTFSNFYAVYDKKGIKHSIKKSISLVSDNYLSVLTMSVIFYIISQLVSYFDAVSIPAVQMLSLGGLLSSLIAYPYFSLVLSRFLHTFNRAK